MHLKVFVVGAALVLGLGIGGSVALATPIHKPTQKPNHKPAHKASAPAPQAPTTLRDGQAEARLLEVYRLIGRAQTQTALLKAGQLVNDFPTFALAQLVYGDLLSARTRPLADFGDVPQSLRQQHASALADLRLESQIRLKALRERPPAGAVPSEFVQLPSSTRHAIAIDASRSRLYLFENHPNGLKLVADYYVSVGKLGIEKSFEGDQKTPLGVYFITSQLDPRTLKDFYGVGALPINYPNVLDLKRGKTGSGIWLHGTPTGQFARAPLSSDGCVVVANPDLQRIINTVTIRSTPVVISRQLKWLPSEKIKSQVTQFEARLQAWKRSKSSGNIVELNSFYAPDFNNGGKNLGDWLPTLQRDVQLIRGRMLDLKDLSVLHWQDTEETMVVTFGEVLVGQRTGLVKRQYWGRRGGQWTIFYEGVI